MLSIEEIKKDIKTLRNISECFTYFMWSEDTESLRRILDYIDQLESDKQKLIEKLEEDIENSNKGIDTNIILIKEYYKNKKEYAQEILEIVKGEQNGISM